MQVYYLRLNHLKPSRRSMPMLDIHSGKPPDGKYVSVNDIEMYYEDHGEGQALLLLHGGTGTSKQWDAYFDRFSISYRVIAPDSRGHGRSNNPIGEWNYSLMADDIAEFIEEVGLHKPHICGWSDGGQIGLELAVRYPGIASSFIIGGAWKENSESNFESLKEKGVYIGPGEVNFKKLGKVAPEVVEIFRSLHSPQGPDYWKELLIGISKVWFTPFKHNDEDLINIKEPILFVIGARDNIIPVESNVNMFRLVPNADLSVLPNADHGLTRTNVDEFSDLVLAFLKRHGVENPPV
jgi:pimeloyl-ACP methyl ester carboxylesterase